VSDGKTIGVRKEPASEMPIISVRHGWAEQDPLEWWKHLCAATKFLLKSHAVDNKDIEGIGISYQMHGLVLIDQYGTPLRKAIIWCDSRAVEIGARAQKDVGDQRCASRLLNSPGNFTASKLKWVKENETMVYNKIYKAMLPGDFIAYKLSSLPATTISGLSEGIFWDFKDKKVASWLLEHLDLNEGLLPDIYPTFGFQGTVTAKAAAETGLAAGTPILYRAGDQPNNALSLNVLQPGEIAMTGGTSGVVYAVSDKTTTEEISRINTFAHVNYTKEKPIVGHLLCINGTGIQYRWLKENLSVSSYEEMNHLAGATEVGSEGLLLYPFGNGAERFLQNRVLGTSILNLDLNRHSKAHLCRAALEGIAFSFVYGIEILKKEGLEPKVIRAGNDNLFQSEVFSNTISTLINHPIELYDTTGAIGAARACGLHRADYESFGSAVLKNDFVRTYDPLKPSENYHHAYQLWKQHLEKQLN
jgi:xylulokinase